MAAKVIQMPRKIASKPLGPPELLRAAMRLLRARELRRMKDMTT